MQQKGHIRLCISSNCDEGLGCQGSKFDGTTSYGWVKFKAKSCACIALIVFILILHRLRIRSKDSRIRHIPCLLIFDDLEAERFI